jgi:hypothetical protein
MTEIPSQAAEPATSVQGTKHTVKIAQACLELNIPVAFYFHDVYFDILGGDVKDLKNVTFISNSIFTKNKVEEVLGVSSNVVPPMFFDAAQYEVSTRLRNVTFINPVPDKGSEIAFKVPELCPHIPFHFVEGWSLNKEQQQTLDRQLKWSTNVRFSPHVYDMRQI